MLVKMGLTNDGKVIKNTKDISLKNLKDNFWQSIQNGRNRILPKFSKKFKSVDICLIRKQ